MKKNIIPILLGIILLVIPACLTGPAPTETPTPLSELQDEFTPTPQASLQAGLTVCLGQEPDSLYPFGELNSAARTVLAAIYDGPIDTIAYEYQPVILTKLPSLENGDAQIVKIEIDDGDTIVDADGKLIQLQKGARVRPADCRSDDCAVTYDGVSPLEMDQMIVTFRMRPDLTWSDGTALTADDSIYAFEVQNEANLNPFFDEEGSPPHWRARGDINRG